MSYIVKQKDKAGIIRIYLAENHYIPEKGQSRQKRVYLGVLDVPRSELLLGIRTKKPEATILEKLKSKGINYKGRRANLPGRRREKISLRIKPKNFIKELNTSNGKAEGLQHIAVESGLFCALSSTFGQQNAQRLLSIGMHQASEGEAMYLSSDWAEEVGIKDHLSSSTLSRLMDEIGSNDAALNNFFRAWIVARNKPSSLIHDTTSISTYARDLEYAEWGYNRDGEDLPQINLSLVVDKEDRIPLCYRILHGSIPDVATLETTCHILKGFGLEAFHFVLDKGFYSTSNIAEMISSNINFTIGVPTCNQQVKKIISQTRRKLNSITKSFSFADDQLLRHVNTQYVIKMSDGQLTKLQGHLYLDPHRKEQLSRRLEIAVLALENKAAAQKFATSRESKNWILDNAGKFGKYLKISYRNNSWHVTRKISAIAETVNDFGLSMIITHPASNNKESVLSNYRSRDIVEKLFDSCKNTTGNNRIRTSNPQRMKGKLFVAFIAYTLLALLESKLKNADLLKKFSLKEAIYQLGKIKKITLPNGDTLELEIPKKARLIAEAIGLYV